MEARPLAKSLNLKREIIRDLSPYEKVLASQGHSLWTCDMTERPDPLTPVETEIEKIEHIIETEIEPFKERERISPVKKDIKRPKRMK